MRNPAAYLDDLAAVRRANLVDCAVLGLASGYDLVRFDEVPLGERAARGPSRSGAACRTPRARSP